MADVSIRKVVKRYDNVEAVRGIDLDVRQGEVFGFLGPNGAGKTTTVRMLRTLLPVSDGVDLTVARGEVLALLGPNGAGKTTTLRSILGLTRARRGRIAFDGRDVTHAPTHEIAQRLVVSPATARTHVSRAMIKLNARDRAQLVVFAYQSGLVTPPGA